MAFPHRDEIRVALLEELARAGGEMKKGDAIGALARKFGLSERDLNVRRGRTQRPQFPNDVAWSRIRLVLSGHIHRTPRGVWRVTDKGMAVGLGKAQLQMSPLRRTRGGVRPQHSGSVAHGAPVGASPVHRHDPARGRGRIAEGLRDKLMAMDSREFQHAAGEILAAATGADFTPGPAGADRGIDGWLVWPLGVRSLRIALQIKKRDHPAGSRDLRNFQAAIDAACERVGIFVSSAGYAKGTEEEVRLGTVKVVCLNLDDLAASAARRLIGGS